MKKRFRENTNSQAAWDVDTSENKPDHVAPYPGLLEAYNVIVKVLFPETHSTRKPWEISSDQAVVTVEQSITEALNPHAQLVEKQGEEDASVLARLGTGNKGKYSLDALPEVAAVKDARQNEISATEMDLVTGLLTNADWENTKFLEACKKLNVDPGQPIRLRGMRKEDFSGATTRNAFSPSLQAIFSMITTRRTTLSLDEWYPKLAEVVPGSSTIMR